MTDTHMVVPVVDSTQRQWAGWVHVAAVVVAICTSWMVGLGGMLVAGLAWLYLRTTTHTFATNHAAEAFNFNLSMLLYSILGTVAAVLGGLAVAATTSGVGLLLALPAVLVVIVGAGIVWIVCSIQAACAGFRGLPYRYPLTWRVLGGRH